jgi:hypothetical protein
MSEYRNHGDSYLHSKLTAKHLLAMIEEPLSTPLEIAQELAYREECYEHLLDDNKSLREQEITYEERLGCYEAAIASLSVVGSRVDGIINELSSELG